MPTLNRKEILAIRKYSLQVGSEKNGVSVEEVKKLYEDFLNKLPAERTEEDRLACIGMVMEAVRTGLMHLSNSAEFWGATGLTEDQYIALSRKNVSLSHIGELAENGRIKYIAIPTDIDDEPNPTEEIAEEIPEEPQKPEESEEPLLEEFEGEVYTPEIAEQIKRDKYFKKYADGEKLVDDRRQGDELEKGEGFDFLSYVSGKVDKLDRREKNPEIGDLLGDIPLTQTIAKSRMEIYMGLQERSHNRTWGEVFKHPFKTFKEWKLKNKVKSDIQKNYGLSDKDFNDLNEYCSGMSMDTGFRGCGNIAKNHLKAPQTAKKEVKVEVVQKDLSHLAEDVNGLNKKEILSPRQNKTNTKTVQKQFGID